MFTPQDLRGRLREIPFKPFRVVTTTGEEYDVRHPDLVSVGARDMMIGFPRPELPSFYDHVTRVAFLHVTEIRDLPVTAGQASNGPTAT